MRPVKPLGPWYRESKFRSAGLASLGSLFPWPLSPGTPLRGGPRARSAAASCSMHDAASSSSRRDESGLIAAGQLGAGFVRIAIMNAPIRPGFHPRREDRHIVKVGGDDIRESAGIVGFSDPEIGFRVPCLQHFLRRLLAMSGGHPQQRLFDLAASPHRAKIVMGDRQPFFDDAPDIARIDLAHRRRSHRGWLPATASRQFRSGA